MPELRAEDLRLALRSLGRITGTVDVEDLLDVIFRDFLHRQVTKQVIPGRGGAGAWNPCTRTLVNLASNCASTREASVHRFRARPERAAPE